MAAANPATTKPVYTEEKAVHLVKVFIAILTIFFLVFWMQVILIRPMKIEAVEMAHLDPSEIRDMPCPLQRLTTFGMFPVVLNMMFWLIKESDKMLTNLISLTKLTLVIYALFALCGDHITKHYQHSLTAALYLATLASTTWTGKTTSNLLEELPIYDMSNLLSTCRLYGMILFAIPFQIVSTLDSGIQLQRWPMPIIFGATYGYIGGTLLGMFMVYRQNKMKEKQRTQ